MIFEYYPGCTLKTTAEELDIYARLSANELGFELHELDNWQCCGASYPQAKDEIAVRLSAVRALALAQSTGHKLVTLCSACHNVIKRTNHAMATDAELCVRINNYLGYENSYQGDTEVLHYLEVLRDELGFNILSQRIKKTLEGQKIGAYYGCLLLRPSAEMCMDDPENPRILEDFIRAIGGEPVLYAMRNECCSGYTTLENESFAQKNAKMILDNAKSAGADIIVTACPLCMYNLKKVDSSVKVVYFTQLLAQALGIEEVAPNE